MASVLILQDLPFPGSVCQASPAVLSGFPDTPHTALGPGVALFDLLRNRLAAEEKAWGKRLVRDGRPAFSIWAIVRRMKRPSTPMRPELAGGDRARLDGLRRRTALGGILCPRRMIPVHGLGPGSGCSPFAPCSGRRPLADRSEDVGLDGSWNGLVIP